LSPNMYPYRGRGGPSKSTPAGVLCQKCLTRGHYSYECKTAPQERPYKARPSRTQQLLNPKLVPRLTSDTPDSLQRKEGVADELLAKREAERTKARESEGEDADVAREGQPKRRRSVSSDSASSISTRSPVSPLPPARSRSPAPPTPHRRQSTSRSPSSTGSRPRRRRSLDSVSRDSRRRGSSSSVRGPLDEKSRGQRSPPQDVRPSRRRRDESFERDRRPRHARSRLESSDFFDDARREDRRRHDSRSPRRGPTRDRDDRGHGNPRRYRDRGGGYDRPERPTRPSPQRGPPRERSLSPFSKRLALTQAMNMK